MKFKAGDRVRSDSAGTYGQIGTVTKETNPSRIYVRWDGDVLAKGYRRDSETAKGLQLLDPKRANTINVAQAVSLAVDERQEGDVTLEGGLYLLPDESATLRITEVSAELITPRGHDSSHFWVSTSDGQRFRVTVTPDPA